MLINGEKYACEACVRGHRVSNCQHSDRRLQHINKKGRPVSQCQECRLARRPKSSLKCDCGERTCKCAHLHTTLDGHTETCCFNHGGRCTCATRNKSPKLNTVQESDSDKETSRAKAVPRKRRGNATSSDNAHQRTKVSKASQHHHSRTSPAINTSSLGSESGLPSPLRERSARASTRPKSGTASPQLPNLPSLPSFPSLASKLPQLDMSVVAPYPSYVNRGSGNFEFFGSSYSSERDAPILSASLSPVSGGWGPRESFTPSSYSHSSQGYSSYYECSGGVERYPHLAGTATTSGEVSEVEDNFPDIDRFAGRRYYGQHLLDYDGFKGQYLPMPASLEDDGPIAGNPLHLFEDETFCFQTYGEDDDVSDTHDGLMGHVDSYYG